MTWSPINGDDLIPFLSLGAGVQSTTLYLMAIEGVFEKPPIHAIFADTQWEPDEVYRHLDRLEEIGGHVLPIHRVTVGNLKQDVLDSIGPIGQEIGTKKQPPYYVKRPEEESRKENKPIDPGGMLWRNCTKKYKIKPIQNKIRELLGYKPRQRIKEKVQQWIGISLDEATRMKDNPERWMENYYPLIEKSMTRTDCLKWIKDRGYSTPRKSACIACPYHSNNYWVDMEKNHPDEWADAVKFDKDIRKGHLPGVTGLAYVHRTFLPLEEAVRRDNNQDQLTMFEQECEGMCGV